MMPLILLILYVLLAIAVVVGLYHFTVWILNWLGVVMPVHILRVIFVIIGLAVAIYVLSGRSPLT